LAKHAGETAGGIGAVAIKNLSDEYVAVLVIAIANRLTRGASKYYRETYDLGVVEWRIIICLGHASAPTIGEIADATDLDRGATSRSIKLLADRGLVRTETGAGRINRARLTRQGETLFRHLKAAGRRREDRLMAAFTPTERKQLLSHLRRLLSQVDFMNSDEETAAPLAQNAAGSRR
jgi:DNA-binding MarR family transcriptional regulator